MTLEINAIHEMDTIEGMREIGDKSVDMILCDLPYGTTACKWDTIIPFDELWAEYERVIKDNGAIVLTSSQPFTSALVMSNPKMFKYEVIWEKDKASNFMLAKKQIQKYHENICIFYKKQPTYNPPMVEVGYMQHGGGKAPKIKKGGVNGDSQIERVDTKNTVRYPKSVQKFNKPVHNDGVNGTIHPTQKPVALFEYLIRTYTNENEIVLDNTIGSGTTAVAAINTGRRFIGIERDPSYVESANQRITEALAKLDADNEGGRII